MLTSAIGAPTVANQPGAGRSTRQHRHGCYRGLPDNHQTGAEIGLGLIDGASFNVAAICGLLAAFVFGILTIGALVKLATRVRFWKFCIVLGILSLLPLLIERL